LDQLAQKRIDDYDDLVNAIDKAISQTENIQDFTSTEKAEFEKELLGHYVSHHPLDEYRGIL